MEQKRLPSVEINNQDELMKILLHCINKKKIININVNHYRLSINPFVEQVDNFGNKIKVAPDLLYLPVEGRYPFKHKYKNFWITFQRDDVKIVTPQRKIEYIKRIIIQCQQETVYPIRELIKQIIQGYGESGSDGMIIYENSGGSWIRSKNKHSRTLQSVILDKEISEKVITDLTEFIESQEWYKRMGVPYRRSYLLHGPPGTGKSSFTQALANYFKFSICFINVSDRMNDFGFNYLLNQAPKKSIILIQDVDAMFQGRKNKEHANYLTYSGFLNAIDGVRSQQGRVIIMTTNHKQRLDPALLRPGRTDAIFQLSYASKSQIYKLFKRFFENEEYEELAVKLAELLPQHVFSMSQLQGFFVKYKKNPRLIIQNVNELLNSEENVRVQQFLQTINCPEVAGQFKIENCFNLSSVKNLPNQHIQKILSSRISKEKLVRLIQFLRNNNFKIQRSKEELINYANNNIQNKELKKQIIKSIQSNSFKTIFHLKDHIALRNKEIIAEYHKKQNKKKEKEILKNRQEPEEKTEM